MPRTPPANTSTLILRPAAQRFHIQLDWLDSWHSFSFGSHQDPNWMGFGPLRMINDDTLLQAGVRHAPPPGDGNHHGDGVGALTHADSMGNRAVLRAG